MTSERDPRWWYVAVLAPMVGSLVLVVGVAVATAATATASADLSAYAPAYFALALVGVPVAVAYPVALYRDAADVGNLDADWTPDPARYAAAGGVAAATGLVLAVPVSVHYLRKRRRAVGLE